MKHGPRVFFTMLLVPAVGVLLLGCAKKVTKLDETPQPRVNELVGVTRPMPPPSDDPGATGRRTDDQRTAQLLASRGEDIPIKESPTVAFVAPSPEDEIFLRKIYFEYDKSNIRPEYQTVLENVSKWMERNAGHQLLIEGHCDERGTDEYNLALGERRALAVRSYLVALGVSADRVHTISYGEEKPAVAGSTEAAWSKNRRAEFKVSEK